MNTLHCVITYNPAGFAAAFTRGEGSGRSEIIESIKLVSLNGAAPVPTAELSGSYNADQLATAAELLSKCRVRHRKSRGPRVTDFGFGAETETETDTAETETESSEVEPIYNDTAGDVVAASCRNLGAVKVHWIDSSDKQRSAPAGAVKALVDNLAAMIAAGKVKATPRVPVIQATAETATASSETSTAETAETATKRKFRNAA